MDESNLTPMMKQYLSIKSEYPDCILFYRMGDFYEMFLEDAENGSRVLGIALTSRDKGNEKKIKMAGVPFHAADSYVSKLVGAGYKVAIAEQVSDPKLPGIVERKVVRVVTPGTVQSDTLNRQSSNFLLGLTLVTDNVGIAVVDLSTGEFGCSGFGVDNKLSQLIDELVRIKPVEIILPSELYLNVDFLGILTSSINTNIFVFNQWGAFVNNSVELLESKLGKSIEVWGLDKKIDKLALEAASAVVGYLEYTQKRKVVNINSLKKLSSNDEMRLDRSTIINLELFNTLREGEYVGSLISVIDNCITGMGSRMIRSWLRSPLLDLEKIRIRSSAIGVFVENVRVIEKIRDQLKHVRDIERLFSRISSGWGNARDLVALRESIKISMSLKSEISQINHVLLNKINQCVDPQLQLLIKKLDDYLVDDPPADMRSGQMIRSGINSEIDEWREINTGVKQWLEKYELEERERTRINSLKVRFNKVFGFYIEISRSKDLMVPSNYVRKQTLVNAERYITEELKLHEEKVLIAEQRLGELEFEIYEDLIKEIIKYVDLVQNCARSIGELDCLVGLANLAIKNKYVEPIWNDEGRIELIESRHPVVEGVIKRQFVPNDVNLDHNQRQVLIITGPNMAGKSVYLRQVATICLMAQIGCWVPAKNANLCIVDRVFVRSGASDSMARGLSTFMVEMTETASILAQATSKSLIVMDEIGRGTSTFDGISLAWGIAEWLVGSKFKREEVVRGPKTLFATHYHELQQLAEEYVQIKNVQVAVVDQKGVPVFLHKVIEGGASHSYGVAVAKMAGLPDDLIERSKEILAHLEGKRISKPPKKLKTFQLGFGLSEEENLIVQKLKEIDVNNLTPIDALNWLSQIKKEIKG